LEDVSELAHGIKEKCIFNEIPYFDYSINITCDIMHDLFEEVYRYNFTKIIQYFTIKKYFTIEQLNDRIKYFNHNSEFDKENKICK